MASKDVFICHASEDKQRYVQPLTKLLSANGITYWLDQEEIKVGDDLRERIDEAIGLAKYGLVIISKNFISKEWANRELQLIKERENAEGRIILLPIIEDTAKEEVLQSYSFLRNRHFLQWSEQKVLVSHLIGFLNGTESPNTNLPYDYFLHRLKDLNAVVYWTSRPVPKEETKDFFEALQRFFYGNSPFLAPISDSLRQAMDRLCRVLGYDPEISKGYGAGKLTASITAGSRFLEISQNDRTYEVDLSEMIFLCEEALSSSGKFSTENKATLTLYLMLLRYLKAYRHTTGYHQLHHEVGTQLHQLLSITIPTVMTVELPDRYDEEDWDEIYRMTKYDAIESVSE